MRRSRRRAAPYGVARVRGSNSRTPAYGHVAIHADARERFVDSIVQDQDDAAPGPTDRVVRIPVLVEDMENLRAIEQIRPSALWDLMDAVRRSADPLVTFDGCMSAWRSELRSWYRDRRASDRIRAGPILGA